MLKRTSTFLAAAWVASGIVMAQQLPLGNQYLLNGFSLSPAYAGANDNIEALLSYRKDWSGVSGSPESRLININGALPEILGFIPGLPNNMGIGAAILSEEAGIFRTTGMSLSYAYKIKIAALQSIRLGLSAGLLESNIDLSDLGTQGINDPVVMNNQDSRTRMFDAGFGALYRFQNFDFGVAVPRLIESKVKDTDNDTVYTFSRHYLVHASYLYSINKQFQVQPFLVGRTTANSGFLYEAAAMVRYQNQLWLALMYRKGGTMGISMGGKFYHVVQMGYSYEFSGEGMLGKSSGTHEISLGFIIGGNKSEVPASTPKKPYYDWIKN